MVMGEPYCMKENPSNSVDEWKWTVYKSDNTVNCQSGWLQAGATSDQLSFKCTPESTGTHKVRVESKDNGVTMPMKTQWYQR